jgi:hypothetical protein
MAADLRYDFLITGLSLTLTRAGRSMEYESEISMNHAYIRTALSAGTYSLTVNSTGA